MPERLGDHLLRHLRGARAVGMAAHAIDDHQQRRMLGDGRADPILVLLAPAEQADFGIFDPQEQSMHLLDLADLYHLCAGERSRAARRRPASSGRSSRRTDSSMIASMTGFARREASGAWGTLVCELRSVNHRFLEAGLRLPDELRVAEGELRARLAQAAASRQGRLHHQLSAAGRRDRAARDRSRGARAAARRRAHGGARTMPQAAAVNALEVLRWPGVVRDESAAGEELLAAAYALFGATLDELVAAACARRGAAARAARAALHRRSRRWSRTCAPGCPRCRRACARGSNERLAELAAGVDPERLEQELAILLQRLDVDEELERLTRSHRRGPPRDRAATSRPGDGWIF